MITQQTKLAQTVVAYNAQITATKLASLEKLAILLSCLYTSLVVCIVSTEDLYKTLPSILIIHICMVALVSIVLLIQYYIAHRKLDILYKPMIDRLHKEFWSR